MSTQSCILFQDPSKTVTLIDIPHSIEHAQGPLHSRKLISSKPLEHPFPSVEPKSQIARHNLGDKSIDELLLQRFLEFALDEVRGGYVGDWCLERVNSGQEIDLCSSGSGRKRKREVDEASFDDAVEEAGEISTKVTTSPVETEIEDYLQLEYGPDNSISYHNDKSSIITAKYNTSTFYIPPKSTILQGDIALTRDTLAHSAPFFNLIVLDPPWPNRSARRKKSYGISYDSVSISSLLQSIPVESKLSPDGLLAVWVTNKASFRDMLLCDGGLFDHWDVKLVEEWVWVKITNKGETICALDSTLKKPYEILLVGKRALEESPNVKRRVIIGVPDVHSRKPNLKGLFESIIGKGDGEYQALEVFARNITAGWWSWGNEVLKFQSQDHWVTEH